MALKLTWTTNGANLSDADGYVTHELMKPGYGFPDQRWSLYELVGPYSKRYIGKYDTPELAQAAAESAS